MIKAAGLSGDKLYRYWLTRTWGEYVGETMIFVMLNPSTADASVDDPTIKRCVEFAKREGCSGLAVINLFSLRATYPEDLRKAEDAIGPDCGMAWNTFMTFAKCAGAKVVCAWGAHKFAQIRGKSFFQYFEKDWGPLYCLGTTKDGHPKHPLYLRSDSPLEVYRGPKE